MSSHQKDIVGGLLLIGIWLTWAVVMWQLDGGGSGAITGSAYSGEVEPPVVVPAAPAAVDSGVDVLMGPRLEEIQPDCAFIWGLSSPAVELPCPMARNSWAVLMCENRSLDPAAVSRTQDYGLWQLNRVQEDRASRLGYSWADMLTAGPNTEVAIQMWQEQGFGPWSCKP